MSQLKTKGLPDGTVADLNFDLWSLRVFLAVCETGSMTAAAQQMNLTQPAVSRVIQNLEAAIGLQLVDRNLRPIGLTAAGGMLRQRAAQLVAEAIQIVPAVRQSARGKLSLLRIGIIDSVAGLLGPVFARDLAGVANQLTIWSGLSTTHGDSLLKRQLDLIVTCDALEDVDGLERITLVHEPHVLLVPAKLKNASIKSLESLARDYPLIRYSARSYSGIHIDRHLRRVGIDIPRRQEFDSTELVVAMVAAGLGWSITTPLCLLSTQYDSRRVIPRPLPGPGFTRRILIMARSGEFGRLPATVAEAARDAIRDSFLPQLRATMPWTEAQVRIGSYDAV